MAKWKDTPVTIGLIVAMIGLVGGVVALYSRGEAKIRQASKAEVESHCDKDIDKIHPSVKEKYLQRADFVTHMHSDDLKYLDLKTDLGYIKLRLSKSKHWEWIDDDLRKKRGKRGLRKR
jgi:hypothetical protein